MILVKEEEDYSGIVRFAIVLLLNDERPSWKLAFPGPVSAHYSLYDLVQPVLTPGLCSELKNAGSFFSCENWGGEGVSSQLGEWHGIKRDPVGVYRFSLKILAKSQTEGQSGLWSTEFHSWSCTSLYSFLSIKSEQPPCVCDCDNWMGGIGAI